MRLNPLAALVAVALGSSVGGAASSAATASVSAPMRAGDLACKPFGQVAPITTRNMSCRTANNVRRAFIRIFRKHGAATADPVTVRSGGHRYSCTRTRSVVLCSYGTHAMASRRFH